MSVSEVGSHLRPAVIDQDRHLFDDYLSACRQRLPSLAKLWWRAGRIVEKLERSEPTIPLDHHPLAVLDNNDEWLLREIAVVRHRLAQLSKFVFLRERCE